MIFKICNRWTPQMKVVASSRSALTEIAQMGVRQVCRFEVFQGDQTAVFAMSVAIARAMPV